MNITHVKSNRHFCNKIWQAFKFIQSHLGKDYKPVESYTINDEIDQWILSRLNHMVESCDTHFKTYDLQNVTRALHGFWLNDFCDVYLVSIFKNLIKLKESEHILVKHNTLHQFKQRLLWVHLFSWLPIFPVLR